MDVVRKQWTSSPLISVDIVKHMSRLYKKRQVLKAYFLLLSIAVTLFSCQRKEKFDKARWAEVGDAMTFPNRKYMIDDLIQNHQLKGKTYHDLVKLLGQPQSEIDSTLQVFYDIDVDYGWDIDPVYTKTLSIVFDKDTIVKSFEVQEWKK